MAFLTLKSFLGFWHDFIVGDDGMVAAGVVALLISTGIALHAQLQSVTWMVMPIGVLAVLVLSVRRAISR